MGFNRGTKLGAENRKGHRWINNPNNAHKSVRSAAVWSM